MAASDTGSLDPTDYGSSFDNAIALSTVDPNPTLDSGSSAGGTDYTDILNSVGQWGSTIASIATQTPVARTPSGTILGAQQKPLFGSTTNNQMLLTVLIVAIVAFAVFSLARAGKKAE